MRAAGVIFLTQVLLIGACICAVPAAARAQQGAASTPAVAAETGDHAIVFELGAAGGWSKSEGFQPGGTVAFEVTPIERWLELESGVTAVRKNSTTETSVDLLFKKPWPISRRFEFMAGVGPEVIHAAGTEHRTFWGLEAVADFMIWPRPNVGWYVEPGYELTFRDGTHRSGLGIAVGLLIAPLTGIRV
jgi:hypothetical protein